MRLSYLSIYFAAIYDDAIVLTYLTIRGMLSKEMKITSEAIYNSAMLYTIGFLVGGIVANVLVKRVCSSRMLVISQLLLLVVTVAFLCCNSAFLMFGIRFLQGILISCCLVSINVLLKQNFSQFEFNRFLAISAIFNCVAEGAIPMLNGFLNKYYGFRASVGLMIFIISISMMVYFLRFKDTQPKAASFSEAIETTFISYKNIIFSHLILLLFVAAISEGFIDIVLHLLEDMLVNVSNELPIAYIFPISVSLISVFASIGVNLASISETKEGQKHSKFNWEYICSKDRFTLINLILFTVFVIGLQILLSNIMGYKLMLFTIICISTTMYIINYIASKTLYSIYYSPGCVVSSISLFESSVSTVMQFISFRIIQLKNNKIIFLYFMFFAIITLIIIQAFYFLTNGFSRNSQKTKKLSLPL